MCFPCPLLIERKAEYTYHGRIANYEPFHQIWNPQKDTVAVQKRDHAELCLEALWPHTHTSFSSIHSLIQNIGRTSTFYN